MQSIISISFASRTTSKFTPRAANLLCIKVFCGQVTSMCIQLKIKSSFTLSTGGGHLVKTEKFPSEYILSTVRRKQNRNDLILEFMFQCKFTFPFARDKAAIFNCGGTTISQTGAWGANCKGGGTNLLFWRISPENCMKMKKKIIGGDGRIPGTPLGSANFQVNWVT